MRHVKNCVVHMFPQVIAMPERSLKVWIAGTGRSTDRIVDFSVQGSSMTQLASSP